MGTETHRCNGEVEVKINIFFVCLSTLVQPENYRQQNPILEDWGNAKIETRMRLGKN